MGRNSHMIELKGKITASPYGLEVIIPDKDNHFLPQHRQPNRFFQTMDYPNFYYEYRRAIKSRNYYVIVRSIHVLYDIDDITTRDSDGNEIDKWDYMLAMATALADACKFCPIQKDNLIRHLRDEVDKSSVWPFLKREKEKAFVLVKRAKEDAVRRFKKGYEKEAQQITDRAIQKYGQDVEKKNEHSGSFTFFSQNECTEAGNQALMKHVTSDSDYWTFRRHIVIKELCQAYGFNALFYDKNHKPLDIYGKPLESKSDPKPSRCVVM